MPDRLVVVAAISYNFRAHDNPAAQNASAATMVFTSGSLESRSISRCVLKDYRPCFSAGCSFLLISVATPRRFQQAQILRSDYLRSHEDDETAKKVNCSQNGLKLSNSRFFEHETMN